MKEILALYLMAMLSSVYAANPPASCGVHTWRKVSASAGTWTAKLQMLNQDGRFVDSACNAIRETMVNSANPLEYGFGFANDADFNIAYTLTLIAQDKSFQSKTCVFVVTANGPAQPDIHAISYHGAKCNWKVVNGVGEDFQVA